MGSSLVRVNFLATGLDALRFYQILNWEAFREVFMRSMLGPILLFIWLWPSKYAGKMKESA